MRESEREKGRKIWKIKRRSKLKKNTGRKYCEDDCVGVQYYCGDEEMEYKGHL
ncbi:MAG: hypothetical protein GY777_30070 [Candidatus Brocadiaceae bacterium]|nr:hypothetical protein [Candidatus Brocadiaceae bacterium]